LLAFCRSSIATFPLAAVENQSLPHNHQHPQVLQYQAQCRKLPKALRDWQAYVDCRDTIDNFLEMLPLFQAGHFLPCMAFGGPSLAFFAF
jgi:hypothetical protein